MYERVYTQQEVVAAAHATFYLLNARVHPPDLHFSLHDALPISGDHPRPRASPPWIGNPATRWDIHPNAQRVAGFPIHGDRKSTRLNSSHVATSYAVFCLKKKKTNTSSALLYTQNRTPLPP